MYSTTGVVTRKEGRDTEAHMLSATACMLINVHSKHQLNQQRRSFELAEQRRGMLNQ